MKTSLFAVTMAAAVSLPPAAFSQEKPAATEVEAEAEADTQVFGAGDFDILLNVGFNLLYIHLEPALDVGVIPIGGMTLSFGGGFGVGYCLLCGALTALTDVSVSGQYWFPHGRVNLHLGTLGDLLPDEMDGWTLDPYAGFYLGPQFYQFDLASGGTSIEASQTSIALGPVLGIRLGAKNNTFLLFGEYRYGTEFGFTTVTIETEDGSTQTLNSDDIGRKGSDFILGLGLRI